MRNPWSPPPVPRSRNGGVGRSGFFPRDFNAISARFLTVLTCSTMLMHFMQPRWSRFSPGSFQVSGNPAGGSASRVSRYASARKSQRLLFTQMFLRFILLRSCSFDLFLFLFLCLICLFFFSTGHVTNSFCKRNERLIARNSLKQQGPNDRSVSSPLRRGNTCSLVVDWN